MPVNEGYTRNDEAGPQLAEASEAFAQLGNETRMTILKALVQMENGRVHPIMRSFKDLFDATGEETSAGFAYHLRQLRDTYIEKTDDGYRLTYAGLRVVREIAAGTFTEQFDVGPVSVPDPCPVCDGNLTATGEDNVLAVTCTNCELDVLSLPFPPGGHATHKEDDLLEAFDGHHRHRIRQLREGSCPDCGGATDRSVTTDDGIARASFSCSACGYAVCCPVALTVLDHPAVVSLFYDHGKDVRDRPLWNVGPEWTETVLSTDPICVRVGVNFDEDHLILLVGVDGSVGYVERSAVDPPESDYDGGGNIDEGVASDKPEGNVSDSTVA